MTDTRQRNTPKQPNTQNAEPHRVATAPRQTGELLKSPPHHLSTSEVVSSSELRAQMRVSTRSAPTDVICKIVRWLTYISLIAVAEFSQIHHRFRVPCLVNAYIDKECTHKLRRESDATGPQNHEPHWGSSNQAPSRANHAWIFVFVPIDHRVLAGLQRMHLPESCIRPSWTPSSMCSAIGLGDPQVTTPKKKCRSSQDSPSFPNSSL